MCDLRWPHPGDGNVLGWPLWGTQGENLQQGVETLLK